MLTIMHGLPGSGKTTKAKALIDFGYAGVRVNRDDIRTALFGEEYHKGDPKPFAERQVTKVLHHMIRTVLESPNMHIVSDDTNLNPKAVRELEKIAESMGTTVTHWYVDTPIAQCKVNNANRDRIVPEWVIDSMALKALNEDGTIRRFGGEDWTEIFDQEAEGRY